MGSGQSPRTVKRVGSVEDGPIEESDGALSLSLTGIDPITHMSVQVAIISVGPLEVVILRVAVPVGDVQTAGVRYRTRRRIGKIPGEEATARLIREHGPAARVLHYRARLATHEDCFRH